MKRALLLATIPLTLLGQGVARAAIDAPPGIVAAVAASKMPTVPNQQIIVGDCPGLDPQFAVECTWLTSVAPIYLHDATDTFALYHGLGHRYDAVVLTQGNRNRFGTIMRYRRTISLGDERLADAYAACSFGWRAGKRAGTATANFPTGYLYWPTARQHRRVCGMLRRAAR